MVGQLVTVCRRVYRAYQPWSYHSRVCIWRAAYSDDNFIFLVYNFWRRCDSDGAISPDLVSPGLVAAVQADTGSAIFKLVEYYPLTKPITLLSVVMIVLWFVTSSDSASFVIDMLTAGGDTNPPKIQRLFWAIMQGVIAAILLAAGGLGALQAAAIVAGLPFALVIFVMMYALLRGMSRDRLILYRNQQRYITDESADHNSANEFVDEELLKGPPKIVKGD